MMTLGLISEQVERLRWSPTLIRLLIQELHVEDDFRRLLGNPNRVAVRQYPQVVVVALAIRHSWRGDDLRQFARRLRLNVPPVAS